MTRIATPTNAADTLVGLLRILAPDLLAGLELEHGFAPPRRWRFDLAWPAHRVAVEVNGGRWKLGGGRHGGPGDAEKLRRAAVLGWRVLPVLPEELERAPLAVLADLRDALRGRPDV